MQQSSDDAEVQDADGPAATDTGADAAADTAADAEQVVSLEVVDRVAHVRIERPHKRNAMSLAVFDQLTAHAATIAQDPEVGAVVVSGRDGVFSAGIDLEVLGTGFSGEGLQAAFVARLQAAFTAYEDLDVPTIAAIERYCFGAGIQLALACHLRAVAPDAQLSVMERRWALVPDLGGTVRLPRLVGPGRATELILSARTVDAEEAVRLGLAELTLPPDAPIDAAHALAAELAAGPGALREVPRLVRENLTRSRADGLAAEAAAQQRVTAGPDVREAMAAGLEGRAPRFVGR
ncbi:MAG: enoyl-CoA hydratase/isomerase family protein [Nitriliruptoraceae bacterium]|nr:enoyl-CoA hydratase/isomerase family protein [Nitriliruptoraceae bacterium]